MKHFSPTTLLFENFFALDFISKFFCFWCLLFLLFLRLIWFFFLALLLVAFVVRLWWIFFIDVFHHLQQWFISFPIRRILFCGFILGFGCIAAIGSYWSLGPGLNFCAFSIPAFCIFLRFIMIFIGSAWNFDEISEQLFGFVQVINLLNMSDNVDLPMLSEDFFRMRGAKQKFYGAIVSIAYFFL